MQPMEFDEKAKEVLEILKKGAFLTTAADGKINTMTIGWGGLCYAWRSPVFMAMVRQNRQTHALLEASGQFTVTLPTGDMKKELAFCGVNSGRDTDKFAACGLRALPGKTVDAPVIDCPAFQYECRVVFKSNMPGGKLSESVREMWYGKAPQDYHTLYFGEILSSYVS